MLCLWVLSCGSTPNRPNVLLILADDWGWGDLSSHGNGRLRTPNLDALAEAGLELDQFDVASPVCSPSRAAILTGLYPARLSIHEHLWNREKNAERGMPDWLDPRVATLPRLFQTDGYATAHFGKWHLTSADAVAMAPSLEDYGYDEAKVWNGPGPQANHREIFDLAIDFMTRNRDRPFLINLWIHETHVPHMPLDESVDRYAGLSEQERVYAAVVDEADAGIGRVLAALRRLGLEENTIVIFSSDNGPEWTGPASERGKRPHGYPSWYSVGSTNELRGRKRSLYEGGIRLPFIVRWPGHTPAGVTNRRTVLTAVDLLPTLCAAAGIALPDGHRTDGENLLPALLGSNIERTRPIFWEWRGVDQGETWPRLGIRKGPWKLLLSEPRDRVELYRITDDRAERRDLSSQHPAITEELKLELLAWKASLPGSLE